MTGCRTMLKEYSFLCRRPIVWLWFYLLPIKIKISVVSSWKPYSEATFLCTKGRIGALLTIRFQESHILLSLASLWSCEDVWNALSSITGPSQSFRMTSKKKWEAIWRLLLLKEMIQSCGLFNSDKRLECSRNIICWRLMPGNEG